MQWKRLDLEKSFTPTKGVCRGRRSVNTLAERRCGNNEFQLEVPALFKSCRFERTHWIHQSETRSEHPAVLFGPMVKDSIAVSIVRPTSDVAEQRRFGFLETVQRSPDNHPALSEGPDRRLFCLVFREPKWCLRKAASARGKRWSAIGRQEPP